MMEAIGIVTCVLGVIGLGIGTVILVLTVIDTSKGLEIERARRVGEDEGLRDRLETLRARVAALEKGRHSETTL